MLLRCLLGTEMWCDSKHSIIIGVTWTHLLWSYRLTCVSGACQHDAVRTPPCERRDDAQAMGLRRSQDPPFCLTADFLAAAIFGILDLLLHARSLIAGVINGATPASPTSGR